MTICQIESKELNLMMHITRGRIYFVVPHKNPYSMLYYSICIYVTYAIFGRLRYCKLCRWYYDLYGKWKKESLISALKASSSLLFRWFNNNFMKANSDKNNLIISCAEATTAMIDGLPINSSKTEVLLWITIDH